MIGPKNLLHQFQIACSSKKLQSCFLTRVDVLGVKEVALEERCAGRLRPPFRTLAPRNRFGLQRSRASEGASEQ